MNCAEVLADLTVITADDYKKNYDPSKGGKNGNIVGPVDRMIGKGFQVTVPAPGQGCDLAVIFREPT